MQKELQLFFEKQIEVFEQNFAKICESFDFDAIHDMRVAVKRLRAIMMLAEQLQPGFKSAETDIEIRELFRISGKIRDAQVQKNLLATYSEKSNINFSELATFLISFENKSIKKFNKYIHQNTASFFTGKIAIALPPIFANSEDPKIRSAIELLLQQLMETAGNLKSNQRHDEQLHEIRRKLKQCSYLLSVFEKGDKTLARKSKTLHELEKANDLLGEWHDHVVARALIFRFLSRKNENNFPGFSRYKILLTEINYRKQILYKEIVRFMESELGL
ncbi:MAG: CHAD domain-containing protein [Lentimicrobium sp.]|nr:CHAD domain-containing protein [Lentimicrobium sp.]